MRYALLVLLGIMFFHPIQRAEQKVEEVIASYATRPSAQHIEKQAAKVPSFKLTKQELNCLIDNVYYEAGNQSQAGMMAVAYVTLNRARDPRWPSNVCSVVHQKALIVPDDTFSVQVAPYEVCQFSWVCAGINHNDPILRKRAKQAALFAVDNFIPTLDPTHGSVHFHADYVSPAWRHQKVKTTKIGAHIFYR